jgi:RNA polymerase sigma-70 factor (ECF subfamily)
MSKESDLGNIISGCKAGNAESFSQLVTIYSSRLYGYFYRLTGNKDISDELLSELFVKLVVKVRTFKGRSFESWLFKVASNVFYDHLRAKQRQQKTLDARKNQLELKLSAKQSDKNTVDKLQSQLARLDSDTREVIMLRYYSQLSFKEIAEIRSEPLGTTLSKVHRGLKKLRELME